MDLEPVERTDDGYAEMTDIDNAVSAVFAYFPRDTWREAPLRDVVMVARGVDPRSLNA